MRIQDREVVNAPCVGTMEAKDVNGASIPATEIKTDLKTEINDASHSNGILSPPTTPSTTTPSESDYAPNGPGSGRFKFFKGKFHLLISGNLFAILISNICTIC